MFADWLTTRLRGFVDLSNDQIGELEEHFHALLKWNRVINLTSVRDPEQIVERHYCESLFLGAHLPPGKLSIADIGSGAGFPGFPVAVLRPESTVALIESHQRKSVFLRESTRQRPNVQVVSKRAEWLEQKFDWAISRAVKIADIREATSRIAKHGAVLTSEISAIKLPWGSRRFLELFHVEHSQSSHLRTP